MEQGKACRSEDAFEGQGHPDVSRTRNIGSIPVEIGVSVKRTSASRNRAIVVGAGIGGLTAAGALARHFREVIVLERDTLPTHPEHRRGVPQGRHVHGLLGGGLRALDHLFAGFGAALAAAGAVPVRMGLDVRAEQPGYDPFPRRDLGWIGYSMSRPLLEHVVRLFVESNDRVEIRTKCHVREITGSSDGAMATGVRLYARDGDAELVPADLVVDASGRGALTLDFLDRAGRTAPQESSIDVDIRYTCAILELAPGASHDWQVLQTRPDPSVGRRAIMYRIEGGNRWILGLGGVNGDSAPSELGGFIDYARTLRTRTVYDAIRDAQPIGEIMRFAFPRSYRRHFERVANFPRQLLPIADTLCRINPAFGQGMSVAAKEAVLLGSLLEELRDSEDRAGDLAQVFFARLATVLDDPWKTASGDYMYPHLKDSRPADFAERASFQAALSRLAASDPSFHKLMLEVAHLMKPSSVYREPAIAERIAAHIKPEE